MSTALQGEDLAFESLYRLNRPVVYAYALSTLRHPADAEDVTQTTFLNAYTALHRGVAPRDDLQWLLAITRNVCRDRFRDSSRHPKEEQLTDWTPAVQAEDPDYSVSEICKQISELNPRHRKILVMREFEGRSYGEISAELGVSEAAVHTLLARARRTLRDELELGMTCGQARRVSLRHLNGVALRDERRALQRHLRRCADCSAFVGRTPRTPVAQLFALFWLPYRRLLSIFAGTSAPAAPTAGGAALAAKVLAITAIGSTAVGVTVTEVGAPSFHGAGKPAPVHATVLPRAHRTTPLPGRGAALTSAWTPSSSSVGRTGLTHASHYAALPQTSLKSGTTGTSQPKGTNTGDGASAPAQDVAADAPAAAAAPPTEGQQAPATGSPAAAADATPTDAAPVAAATTDAGDSAAAAPDAATVDPANGNAVVGAPATTAPSAADSVDATGTTPAPTPAPNPQGAAHGNGSSGNGSAVGQGGTPPGQAKQADAAGHGHP